MHFQRTYLAETLVDNITPDVNHSSRDRSIMETSWLSGFYPLYGMSIRQILRVWASIVAIQQKSTCFQYIFA